MKADTGPRYNCFALGSLYYPEHGHYACPNHAKQFAIWEESKAHLLELIAPNVKAWAAHWLERGIARHDVESAFENLEGDLLEMVRPEREATD